MPRRLHGLVARALAFNGSSDVVTVPVTPSSTALSVSFWLFKRRFVGSSNDRIMDCAGGGPANGFDIIQGTGNRKIQFGLYTGSQTAAITTAEVGVGEWHYYTCTFDSSGTGTAKIYMDTVLQATDSSCAMGTVSSTLTIGRRSTGASNFANFVMSDFQFFNGTALTQAQINDLYSTGVTTVNPTVKYEFNGGVTDSSGNGNHGTAAGSNYYEFQANGRLDLTSKSAFALDFNGAATNRVVVTDVALLRPEVTSKFTWSYWVYPHCTNNNLLPRFMEKGSHFTCVMGDQTVTTQYNRVALEVGTNGGAVEYWGSTRIQPFRWYFIATTFDDGTCIHYINGRPDLTTVIGNPGPYTTLSSTSGSNLKIANSNGSDRNWPGLMSDIRYYNRVLSQTEILQLMYGVKVPIGLIGQWLLTEGTGSVATDTSGNGNNGAITGAVWESA